MEYLVNLKMLLANHWDEICVILVALFTAAEGITRLTPTKTDDGFMTRVGGLVDKLLQWFPNLKKKESKTP